MKFDTNIIRRAYNRKILTAKKNSPHIFFAAGVVGTIASTVLACRATLRLNETLDEIQKDVNEVKNIQDPVSGPVEFENVYPIQHQSMDLAYVYAKAGLKLTKLYGPSVLVGAASIGLLTGSHVQLTKRNAALMAAYAAVQKAYDDYRERVQEALGEKKELDIYHASQDETFEGKKVKTSDPNKWSPYARFFDEASPNWVKDPELNRLFVQCQQNYLNDRLQVKGHVFLNEAYDLLGIDRSRAGAVVGWVVGPDGDNYIDFGIYEAHNAAFVNGWERSILLDFNVDGVIYDKI